MNEVNNIIQRAINYWRGLDNERQKLQWIYATVAVLGLFIAGLIGLVDMELAQNLLQVVYAATVLLMVNFVVWVIVTALVGGEASDRPTDTPKKSTSRQRK